MAMAKTASPFDVDVEANAKRIRELDDKVLTAVKQTGAISLDDYEQTVHSLQDLGLKVADSIRPELISEIVKVHLSTINRSMPSESANATIWSAHFGIAGTPTP
jgi:hypothetical protein